MYVIQHPPVELLMLDTHSVINLRKITDSDFEELYEINRISENILLDYEIVCRTCEKFLKIYDPVTASLREPTNQENIDFIIRNKK